MMGKTGIHIERSKLPTINCPNPSVERLVLLGGLRVSQDGTGHRSRAAGVLTVL